MSDRDQTWYPSFRPGQVVTAEELNHLGAYLRQQAIFRARATDGYGIIAGLEGRLLRDVREWEVRPGVAVDSAGRWINLREPIRINLCSEGFMEEWESGTHPHVRPVRGLPYRNVTPVLLNHESTYVDTSYTTGTEVVGNRVQSDARIVMVPGRLSLPETPPLYRLRPLQLPTGLTLPPGLRFMRDFHALRDGLHEALGEMDVPANALRRLMRLRLRGQDDSDLLASQDLITVAALNDALYSGWQLARADQYRQIHQDILCCGSRSDVHGGVALGWLYEDPVRGWLWDGRWRSGYVVGSTQLEHVIGYPPRIIADLCKRRIDRVLELAAQLQPMQQEDSWEFLQPQPDAWIITPREYEAGTSGWLRGAGWDRPRKWAKFWPLDPLRSESDPPGASRPSDPKIGPDSQDLDEARTWQHPSPSLLDPVNDPYEFSSYRNSRQIDPQGVGVVALAGLLGHPVDQVDARLRGIREHVGIGSGREGRPIADDETEAMAGLRYCLTASLTAPVHTIYSRSTREVIGFACPLSETERSAAAEQMSLNLESKKKDAVGFLARIFGGSKDEPSDA